MLNKEINVLDKNFCFSNVLKEIDMRLKFNDFTEEKNLYLLNQLKRKNRERKLLLQRKYNHNEILYNLQKAYEENKIFLELKQKLIKEEENKEKEEEKKLPILLNTSKKEENKEKKNKKILIIENKKEKPIEFENVWKEEYLKRLKEKKKMNMTLVNDSENKNDIFDENFKRIKQSNINKLMVLKRIKENNLKVKSKLNSYKIIMEKFAEKKEYNPNYIALEKHTPEIKLDTKSERIFPIKFIKLNNYSDEKKIFKKKLIKNKSYQILYRNNFSINPCSLYNKETNYKAKMNNTGYKSISKSMLNKSTNNSFYKGYLTKSNIIYHSGNFRYKM